MASRPWLTRAFQVGGGCSKRVLSVAVRGEGNKGCWLPPDVTPSVLAPADIQTGSERPVSGVALRVPEASICALGPAEGVNVRAIEGCLGALLICAAFWLAVGVIVWGWL